MLANLLSASSFLQKASRNCYHLLLLEIENKSFSYQPNYATQSCMANSVDPDQPASEEAG